MGEPTQINSTNTGNKIVRASVVIMVAHTLVKAMALALASLLSGIYGVKSVEMDVYSTTFTGIIMTIFLFSEEVLGPAFLPLFMGRKDSGDEEGAWKFASTVLNLQTIIMAASVALVMIFPGWLVMLFTQWSESDGPEVSRKFSLAVKMLRIMAPGLIGLSVGSTTYMILNGYKKFFLAALGDGTFKLLALLSVVVPLVITRYYPQTGTISLLYAGTGVLIGSWGKLATHLIGIGRKIRYYRPAINFKDPLFRRFLLLIAPLLIGIIFIKARDIFNNVWVLSDLEEGTVAANDFGKKIYSTFGFLAPYAASIAMFPFFCEMANSDDKDTLGNTVTRSLRIILFLLLPMSVGAAITSVPIARILYEHGRATYDGVFMAGTANAVYMLGLTFWAVEIILMQAFFSNRRTVVPVVMTIIWSTVSMVISYVGIVTLKNTGLTALIIVAGGFAFACTAKAIMLALILRRKVPIFRGTDSLVYFVKLAILTAGVAGAIYGTKLGYESIMGIKGGGADIARGMGLKGLMLGEVAVTALAGLVSLIGISSILRMEEVPLVYGWAREKLERRSS